MKIRQKLLLGFGLFLVFAVGLGLLAYREMYTISNRLQSLEIADDVAITMLEVRRYEKNFLLFNDTESLPKLREHISVLKDTIRKIEAKIKSEIGEADYRQMWETISEYEGWVDNVVSSHERQKRLTEEIRTVGKDLEAGLSRRDLDKLLTLRRHEKNLMLYKDDESYESFRHAYRDRALMDRPGYREYGSRVNRLYMLYKQDREFIRKMRENAREVQSFTVMLSRVERSAINSSLVFFSRMLALTLIGIVVLGTVVNLKLSGSISRPIQELERVTKKIASGDFSEEIEVEGGDEIASLGRSFNQMEARLKETLSSLEDTVRMLEEKREQLVESEKLASIGLLVAGVAHEINNPLTSVMTFSNLMIEKMPEDDPNREKLKMMAMEANRARTIVKQLLSFARETPARPVKISINEPVKEIVDSMVAQVKFAGVELEMDLAQDMPEVDADPAQIGQVVLNLVQNALDAVTPPGRIEVATRVNGRWAELAVSDTGCGIPEENIRRIFEPFFTTRGASQGTGLGLAVSYGIIKKHGGDITVTSEPGKGATFTVRIPING